MSRFFSGFSILFISNWMEGNVCAFVFSIIWNVRDQERTRNITKLSENSSYFQFSQQILWTRNGETGVWPCIWSHIDLRFNSFQRHIYLKKSNLYKSFRKKDVILVFKIRAKIFEKTTGIVNYYKLIRIAMNFLWKNCWNNKCLFFFFISKMSIPSQIFPCPIRPHSRSEQWWQ